MTKIGSRIRILATNQLISDSPRFCLLMKKFKNCLKTYILYHVIGKYQICYLKILSKSQLEAALGQHLHNKEFNEVTIDSRKINPGDIFIGIRGGHFNGSDFTDSAVQSSCG